jgi:TP901 family phage tail tape measure protein
VSQYTEEVVITATDTDLESTLQRASSQVRSTAASWSSSLTAAGRKLDTIGKSVDAVGKKLMSFGRSATTYITLPLVGIGYAAVKAANDFENSFKQIQTLADPAFIKLNGGLDKVKQKVLALSDATGQSALGLAHALYFAASAGLAPAQVMQVLQMAAKGAATGLGDVDTVTRVLTNTLNAYKGTGLTAAQVMNVMTKAASDSVAETSDFANGLGPVISTAAQAGVSINDLAAAIAQATNVGVPFDRAVTGARFIISALESPSAKAAKAIASIGLSQDQVAKMLTHPGGLEHALQLIYDKTHAMGADGRAAWAAITGGARGAIIANTLVGQHVSDTNSIVKDLGKSAGKTADDFQTAFHRMTTNNPAFAMQKAWNQLKNSLIELGTVLIPIITRTFCRSSSIWSTASTASPPT